MKILLIEDNSDAQFDVARALSGCGHTVVVAKSGTEGLELYRSERPDIVITDIYMAGMDGFALTQAVQALAAPRWQPVLFLSGHADQELQVRALQVGADAYLVKPVAAEMLCARLEALQRVLQMQQHNAGRALELEHYYRAGEEERRLVRQLMQRFIRSAELDDPAVRQWIAATAAVSSDFLAAQRTPNGALHVLLADGSGHGLTASLNVLPVLAPFYRMSEKGYGIETIARELNAKVKELLPAEHSVAVTLAAVDLRERVISVWNGGNPEPVLIGPQGSRAFALRHVPLGALADHEFDDSLDVHGYADGSQLFLYSDGLIEAVDATGEAFGEERLAYTLVDAPAAGRFERLKAAVTRHLGTGSPQDDIALLMVDCRSPAAVTVSPVGHGQPGGIHSNGRWRSTLRLTAAEIRHVDAVPLLLGLAGQFEAVRQDNDRLFVILSELYNNALDHGLLRLDSRLKAQPEGMEAYLAERQARLNALGEGEIELELEQLIGPAAGSLRVSCRDSGPGFDHAAFAASAGADSEMPFGRGLMLLRAMCADLVFNEAGNQVAATLALGPADGEAVAPP
jgi:CheY-like chemotaxis protein/anti-sigma regulatory factor (Ser/Thr protein kinase)